MSANKNVNVCVATSPGLLIEVDANRIGQKTTGLRNPRGQTIIRPPPLRPPDPVVRTSCRHLAHLADQRASGRHAAGRAPPAACAGSVTSDLGLPGVRTWGKVAQHAGATV